MRGYKVVTGADGWLPDSAGPSTAAISSLLPHAGGSSTACLAQRPAVVSTGQRMGMGSGGQHSYSAAAPRTPCSLVSSAAALIGSGGDLIGSPAALSNTLQNLAAFGFASGLPPFPGSVLPEPHQFDGGEQALQLSLLLQRQPTEQTAEGHSSGHSGNVHVDPLTLVEKKESIELELLPAGREPATSAYQLRARSSSLRAAWVEAEEPAEEEDEEEDEHEDEEDEQEEKVQGTPGAKSAAAGSAGVVPKPASSGKGTAASGDGSGGSGGNGGTSGRKRVGRPLSYQGDPSDPGLTDQERRKIKRRIANRESARRVRQKRAEQMDELQIKCTALSQQNARLLSHLAFVENQKNVLVQQVGLMQEKLASKTSEALLLHSQLFQLRNHLPPEVLAQVERDAAAGTPPPASPSPMQGAGMFVPVSPQEGMAPCPGPFASGAMPGMPYL